MEHPFHPAPYFPFLGMLVPISLFFMWGVFLIVRTQARKAERIKLYSVVEKIVSAGQPLPPELSRGLARDDMSWRLEAVRAPIRDLRRAVVLIGLGLGFVGLGAINYLQYSGPNPQFLHGPAALAPIPLSVGLAYLLLYAISRRQS